MLQFREGHFLTPWVRGEVLRRFDFLACDSIEEFQKTSRPAMTANRHTKKSRQQHQKDDRSASGERRFFVLGWDNREKRLALQAAIDEASAQLQQLEQREVLLLAKIESTTKALGYLEQASETRDFDVIDNFRHRHQAQQLNLEREKLLSSNDKIRELKAQQARTEGEIHKLKQARDEMSREHTLKQRELDNGRKFCLGCNAALAAAEHDGTLAGFQQQFPALDELLVDDPLTIDNFTILPNQFQQERVKETNELEERMEPIRKDLTTAMGRFLTKFPSFQADITYDVESLPTFQELHDQIQSDDLPRHEKRFKDRLNEKVLTEVGVMNSHLENEREEIKRKIEEINEALRCMEWRAGTHIRLEPSDTKDVEIRDFRRELAGCLTGYLDGTSQANEETFLRIEKLVDKLRDDNNIRWREKVIDVRNWFNFSARELNSETGEPGSYYDGGTGQSGGEKARLAFLVLVAAIVYQYDIKIDDPLSDKFHFVMVDEMFSRTDDPYARYALELFKQFGLQLLIVAPLDAKARVCERYVGLHAHVVKDQETNQSELLCYTSEQYDRVTIDGGDGDQAH